MFSASLDSFSVSMLLPGLLGAVLVLFALLRPEPRAEYFQAPFCPYRMGGAHSFDPTFHGLCHYQSRVFGLAEC